MIFNSFRDYRGVNSIKLVIRRTKEEKSSAKLSGFCEFKNEFNYSSIPFVTFEKLRRQNILALNYVLGLFNLELH